MLQCSRMRIRLKKGTQRELIEKTKQKLNLSWTKLATYLGTNYHAMHEWTLERCLLPEVVFEQLIGLFPNYAVFVEERLPDNWGQVKAGKVSSGRKQNIPKPLPSVELAEFIGIMLGDGCIYAIPKLSIYQIKIAFNPKNEKSYVRFVSKLADKIGIKSRVENKAKAIYVSVDSKDVAIWLKDYGLCWGNKIKNKASIPYWIKENHEFLAACLRGLVDTDGSVFRLARKYPNTVRIGFTSYIPSLQQDFIDSLNQLGIKSSKVTNHRNICITSKKDVTLFLERVGFNNPKNVERLLNIAPWCSEVPRKPGTL